MEINDKTKEVKIESEKPPTELRFVCPVCGGNSLYIKQIDISEVLQVWSDSEVALGHEFTEEDLGFFCDSCGYELRDEYSAVTFRDDLVAWLLKNCPQTDEGLPITNKSSTQD